MTTASHAEIVKKYDVPGKCSVRIADWPYDCDAKIAHPDHVVYICDTHSVWWHERDWQPADVPSTEETAQDIREIELQGA